MHSRKFVDRSTILTLDLITWFALKLTLCLIRNDIEANFVWERERVNFYDTRVHRHEKPTTWNTLVDILILQILLWVFL